MSSHLSADHPAAQPPGRGSVEALISQARRLKGDVDAVRRDSQADRTDPRGRWQRALYDLALHQLSDLDEHLAQLRDGPAPAPRAGSLLSRVGSAEWNLLTDEAEWSGELFQILGRDPASAPLSLDEFPSLVPTEDRPKLTAMVTDCLVDGRPIDGEFHIVRPDGTVRTVHMMGEPVLDADGSTASMWAVLRDVSELRRSQRAVDETRDSFQHRPLPADAGQRAAVEPREAVLPPWHGLLRFPHQGRPGLDLAAGYLPAAADTPRCGVWYDACSLAGDETLMCVGELPCPDADPAQGPAMVIGALRGLATAGIGPADLPDRLARSLRSTALPPVRGGVYCGYRPGTRTLTWAHGDGPAPLLFRDGTGHGQAGQAETTLEAGDLLLLHTGGLVPAGRQRLLALAPRLTGARSAQEVLRIVAAEIGEPLRREDACVLVARVTPQ
ncbi:MULTISPECIES: SpoIIE family protein phosphatase [unclassified Streptomyces]|uniref:SpoIIE family protein phosphatase n=1 Tax=unclassified Streptomyces TaxID=2593676 RepID=UPI0025B5D308|nr:MULTISPECIES: SpoIIE family protein phosphatase [unclassified Streptomyces]MDN3248337.1 SpoIIE family protein phosphatase [Streptomyces sp. ZSW22]MDN3254473.1 SpoIIE family protein phosphatase [Streptomyces sp. MA25(2023)]